MKTFYTEQATAKGGRAGHVKTEDGKIDMNLSVPKAMGGDDGDGVNPEHFFACAYSACYGGALEAVAKEDNIDLGDYSVSASVSIGRTEEGDFQLAVILDSYLPTVDVETGEKLVNKAHEICPFSRATRDNIDVTLNLLLDE